MGTAKVYINAQEPASPSRNIFQGSLDRNVVLKASTIPVRGPLSVSPGEGAAPRMTRPSLLRQAGVVEIYVQGPLPPNSFKGFGSGETAKLEGIVVTVAFAGCAVPNLAGFCSLPMQTAATASHLLPSRNADNASVDATSTIAEDGGTTVLVLRDGNPVVIRVPLPLGARSLSLSVRWAPQSTLCDALPAPCSRQVPAAAHIHLRRRLARKCVRDPHRVLDREPSLRLQGGRPCRLAGRGQGRQHLPVPKASCAWVRCSTQRHAPAER